MTAATGFRLGKDVGADEVAPFAILYIEGRMDLARRSVPAEGWGAYAHTSNLIGPTLRPVPESIVHVTRR